MLFAVKSLMSELNSGDNVMKSVVYYFTGTGNSLVAARDIAGGLQCELRPIPAALKQSKIEPDADKIVLVFPVYAWGPPTIVRRFVRKFTSLKGKSVYAVLTFGGSPGGTVDILASEIEQKEGNIVSSFGLKMPGNCITLYGAPNEEKLRDLFDDYISKINNIVKDIDTNAEGFKSANGKIFNALFSGFIYKAFLTGLPKSDRKFFSDEKCTNCGICAKVCPAWNIKMKDGRPEWQGHCEQCMACIQWCPAESIQHGKKTIGRKRYHHPDIKVTDMFEQAGEK